MKYPGDGSIEKRNYIKHFLVASILFSFIMIQASVTICSSSALAASPPVNCINPAPPDTGASAPPAPATPSIVLINEVLSFPASQWNCSAPNNASNQENEWIEIYNPQTQPLDLYAARAAVDEGQGTQEYPLPFGSIIAAHGFFVVFPFMNLTSNSYTHLSLVRLVIAQVVIDQVTAPTLTADTSYARIPDGSNNWQITTSPTIDSSNILNSISSTPKAIKTPKPRKATSTPVHTTTRKSTNTHGTNTSSDGTNTTNHGTNTTNNSPNVATPTPSNPGIQPTWSALRLPSSSSSIAQTNNTIQNTTSPPAISSATSADFPAFINKILPILLIIAFAIIFLISWQLYKRHKSTRT